jgi:hypothetical protein
MACACTGLARDLRRVALNVRFRYIDAESCRAAYGPDRLHSFAPRSATWDEMPCACSGQ